MAEDLKPNEGTVVPGEITPVVQEALDQGWVPQDEYDGDPERWVDAGEFVRRGELFRKIESQSKELKDVRKALSELAKHNSKIREVEYARAVEALKAEKKTALAEGDADRVVDLDDKIDLVKEQQRQFHADQVTQVVPQEVHPELTNWLGKNSWYESDKKMRAYADVLGAQLAGTMSPTEVLREVEKEVKERFKEKFSNPNRARASAVESPKSAPARGGKSSAYELTDTERSVMNTLVRQKVLTEDEYVAQLKAIKEKN